MTLDEFKTDEDDEPEREYAPGPEKWQANYGVLVYISIYDEMELDGPPANMEEDMLRIAVQRAEVMAERIGSHTDDVENAISDSLDGDFGEIGVSVRPLTDEISLQKLE